MLAKVSSDHLQPILKRAFDRLARSGDYPKTPDWSRSIRIGMDYPLRVVLSRAIESDEVADAAARLCCQLGILQEADPPGDPPASCTAQRAAEQAGPQYSHAYHLLNSIRDDSAHWAKHGWTAPALAPKSMKLLQKAARAERVPESELASVLEAAEVAAEQLSRPVLREPFGS